MIGPTAGRIADAAERHAAAQERIAAALEHIAGALANDVAGAIGILSDELALPLDRMAEAMTAGATDSNPITQERGQL